MKKRTICLVLAAALLVTAAAMILSGCAGQSSDSPFIPWEGDILEFLDDDGRFHVVLENREVVTEKGIRYFRELWSSTDASKRVFYVEDANENYGLRLFDGHRLRKLTSGKESIRDYYVTVSTDAREIYYISRASRIQETGDLIRIRPGKSREVLARDITAYEILKKDGSCIRLRRGTQEDGIWTLWENGIEREDDPSLQRVRISNGRVVDSEDKLIHEDDKTRIESGDILVDFGNHRARAVNPPNNYVGMRRYLGLFYAYTEDQKSLGCGNAVDFEALRPQPLPLVYVDRAGTIHPVSDAAYVKEYTVDGRWLYYLENDNWYRAKAGETDVSIEKLMENVYAYAITPDGKTRAYLTNDNELYYWKEGWEPRYVETLSEPQNLHFMLANGTFFFQRTGEVDGKKRTLAWCVTTGGKARELRVSGKAVGSLYASFDCVTVRTEDKRLFRSSDGRHFHLVTDKFILWPYSYAASYQ